jgi:hypothetical protein
MIRELSSFPAMLIAAPVVMVVVPGTALRLAQRSGDGG